MAKTRKTSTPELAIPAFYAALAQYAQALLDCEVGAYLITKSGRFQALTGRSMPAIYAEAKTVSQQWVSDAIAAKEKPECADLKIAWNHARPAPKAVVVEKHAGAWLVKARGRIVGDSPTFPTFDELLALSKRLNINVTLLTTTRNPEA